MTKNTGENMNLNETLEQTKLLAGDYQTLVLVEGKSDLLALTALAQRLNIDLEAKHIAIVSMNGATNIRHFLDILTPYRQDIHIAGLYDVNEEYHFRRALEDAGFGFDLTRSDLQTQGFYVCDRDLEEELIRALGVDTILEIADGEGELGAFRKLQMQPEWRGRDPKAQLRRWFGSGATRKIRYAELLAQVVKLDRIPAPLDGLLTYISGLD